MAVKDVKNSLKGALADRTPIVARNFQTVGKVGNTRVVEDAKGERLVLTDVGMAEEPPNCHLLPLLPKAARAGQTLLARFRHDFDTRKLQIKPLSIAACPRPGRGTSAPPSTRSVRRSCSSRGSPTPASSSTT